MLAVPMSMLSGPVVFKTKNPTICTGEWGENSAIMQNNICIFIWNTVELDKTCKSTIWAYPCFPKQQKNQTLAFFLVVKAWKL